MKTYTFQYVRRRNHVGGDFQTKFVKKRSGVFVPNKRWYVGQEFQYKNWYGQVMGSRIVAEVSDFHIKDTFGSWWDKSCSVPLNPGR